MNIEVLTGVAVAAASGSDHLESVDIELLSTGERRRFEPTAMFLFIGSAPHTEMAAGLVAMDENGYILTGLDLPDDGHGRPQGWPLDRDPFPFETNVPGVFAVGDVRAGSGKRSRPPSARGQAVSASCTATSRRSDRSTHH